MCAAIALNGSVPETIMVVAVPVLFTALMACFDLMIGTARANVRWTNEITPIKQSLAVVLALMGGWVFASIPGIVYLKFSDRIGFGLYLALLFGVYAAATALLFLWLCTKGVKKFEELD